jgi:hypothetical protein
MVAADVFVKPARNRIGTPTSCPTLETFGIANVCALAVPPDVPPHVWDADNCAREELVPAAMTSIEKIPARSLLRMILM